jgi:hypothetical protein
LLVAQHGFEWVQVSVGAQHEDAIELLVLLDPVGIDCEVIVADGLEIAAENTAYPCPRRGLDDPRSLARGSRYRDSGIRAGSSNARRVSFGTWLDQLATELSSRIGWENGACPCS